MARNPRNEDRAEDNQANENQEAVNGQMTLNVLGASFPVSAPYAEGHVCNAAEARTLNQTRLENISNQVRKGFAELKGADWTEESKAKAAEIVAERDRDYTFGMGRTGGGSSVARDPLSSEARKIATDILAGKLKDKGTTLAAQRKANKEAIEAKIAEFAQHPAVIAKAQQVLDARKGSSDLFADLGMDTPAAAPEGEQVAAQ